MLKKILLVLVIIEILLGCSGRQKLNYSNIKNSINQYYKDNLFCVRLSPQVDYKLNNKKVYFGDKTIRIIRIDEYGKKINKRALSQMKVLKNNKFYTQYYDEKIVSDNKHEPMYLAKYVLTSKGEKFMSENKGLCIGTAKVKKVNWYTPEVNDKFLILTRVSYLESVDLLNWAKDLFRNFDTDLLDYHSPRNKEAVLFKTNKGWKDLRYIKKYEAI